ncbi:hypothetical protein AKJ50_02355 [candidate division MSBL1 archaeon SCGC-AAA382A13]|uniref:DUF4234 domain-containing protein n=1 Tax=candidate division MSBL1 archaeon SCGC-AAA382A13 TaxID=1698279 RepID=A0A133VDE8_9EURY|nr:hypothetical protein AKJ50_02355 [candidate division MSBL1 archaeon SCGC-AAA382A13]
MDLSEIKRRTKERKKDYIMPIYLPFLPMILTIVTAFLGVLSVLGWFALGFRPDIGLGAGITAAIVIVLVAIISAVLWIYVLYKWIDRRNKHFKRVELLYQDLIDFLEDKGAKNEAKTARRTLREMASETDEKSPALWIILTIVLSPVIFYVYHFLSNDFKKHENKENFLIEDITDAIEAAGGSFKFQEYNAIENRNTILYIVLTIITLGIFGLYWIYTLTKDPNKHFRQSAKMEEKLINSLEALE